MIPHRLVYGSYPEVVVNQGDEKNILKEISVLEQTYIVFRLSSFSRNARNELKHSRKIYFYDNGIRNAILANFAPIETRQDAGALWENYLVSERKKYIDAQNLWVNSYFWRTKEQKEIDLIEESDGTLRAFEFKYSESKKIQAPLAFSNAYPDAVFKVITPTNVEEFLLG